MHIRVQSTAMCKCFHWLSFLPSFIPFLHLFNYYFFPSLLPKFRFVRPECKCISFGYSFLFFHIFITNQHIYLATKYNIQLDCEGYYRNTGC